MNRSKNAIYNVISNFALKVVTIIYGFIIPKIIINSFGSNMNGLIDSIIHFLACITLLESGFGPVIKSVLYKPISKRDKKTIEGILKTSEKIFKKISYIFLVYICILSFIYPMLINKEFDFIFTSSLIIIISISIFAEYYFGMTYRLYLQAEQKNYVISVIQTITYILNIILIIVLTKFKLSIHIIELVSCIVFTLKPILQNRFVKKKYNIILKNIKGTNNIKQKWDGFAQHIAYVIHANTDIVILTFFSDLKEISVYSIYYLIVKGVKAIVAIFITGIDASFGDMIARDEDLKEKFNLYEIMYLCICVICFASLFVLITPFISIYTRNINDVNYIRYTFGYLIVISEFIWAIRQPYNELIKAAGHFKETKNGAWIECFINIIISILLVNKYGIVGVIIGTMIALTIRTIEFTYHTNKYILKRNTLISIKKIFIIAIEFVIIVTICKHLPFLSSTTYINWTINALILFSISTIIVIIINMVIYKNEFKTLFSILKNLIIR